MGRIIFKELFNPMPFFSTVAEMHEKDIPVLPFFGGEIHLLFAELLEIFYILELHGSNFIQDSIGKRRLGEQASCVNVISPHIAS